MKTAVALAHLGADDVVEQGPHRLNDEVEGAGDEQGAVAQGAMCADAGEALGKGAGQELAVEQLPRVGAQLGDRRVLEAPVERAQEVTPVAPVERQQRRRLAHEVGHEVGPATQRGGGGWPARRRCRPRWRP